MFFQIESFQDGEVNANFIENVTGLTYVKII